MAVEILLVLAHQFMLAQAQEPSTQFFLIYQVVTVVVNLVALEILLLQLFFRQEEPTFITSILVMAAL